MKEFKNVLNRLPKQEVNLSSEKVELGLADQLKKALKAYRDDISKYGKELDAYYVPLRALERAIEDLKGSTGAVSTLAKSIRDSEDRVTAEIDKVNKKIKEAKEDLGISIDINDIADLSGLQASNKISSGIQEDAAKLVKYVNSIKKPNF